MQVLLAGVIPALLGAIAGVLLGISAVAYVAIGVVAAVGSFLAGFEHDSAWGAADRGLVAGGVYGIALLIAHALTHATATVSLGSFPPALVVVTALAGMFLTAAGAAG